MPRIEQYTRRVMPRGFQRVNASEAAFGSQIGAATKGLGQSVDQVAQKIEQIKQKRDKSEYINKLSAFKLENIQKQQELSQQEFEDDRSIAAVYQQNLEERASQIEIPESMQDQWTQDLANMRIDFAQTGFREQAKRVGERAVQDYENTVQSLQNMASLDPNRIDEALELAGEAVSAIPDAAQRIASKEAAFDNIRASAANAELRKDPFEFKRQAQEGKYNDLPNLGDYLGKAEAAIEKAKKEAQKNAIDTELLLNAKNGTSYLDPNNTDHKKTLDKYYQQFPVDVNQGLSNMDIESANIAQEFVKAYKIVPESMQGTIRGMMNGGNPEQKQFAYEFVNDIQSVGAAGFSKKEIEDAATYFGYVSAGYNGQDAVSEMTLFNTPDFLKKKELYREKFKDEDIDPEKDIKEIYAAGWFNLAPSYVDATAQQDYAFVAEREYLKTGDIEQAKRTAKKIISEKYQQTEILGSEMIISHPPENYGHPALDEKENRKWMQRTLKKDLKSLNKSTELDKYMIVPLFENDDIVNAGGQPRYYLLEKETNNYIRDENNNPLVYFFDPKEGAKVAKTKSDEEASEKLKRESRAKAFREMMLDPDRGELDKFLLNAANQSIGALEALGIEVQ